jgi:ATPase family associated with various cellular activities (AAA)
MPGAQTAFVSVLAALLYARLRRSHEGGEKDSDPLAGIDTMLAYGLIAKRRLLQAGFAVNEKNLPFKMAKTKVAKTKREVPRLYYSEGIFSLQTEPPQTNEDPFASPPNPLIRADGEVKQRAFFDPLSFDEAFKINLAAHRLAIFKLEAGQFPEDDNKDWSIFKKVTGGRPHSDYCDYVIKGKTPAGVPICSFGKIKTADVSEIEDFRTVGNLLQSYLSNASAGKPLGVAVFGPPGSGKSFAVKNIVDTLPEALKKLTKDDRHECNLTALSDPEDLAHYFQLARNSVLRGKIPMLFFDEFDCTVGDSPFFWLKHFLAPLQDGEFRSDQIVHPLGRVIFVFAGGIYKKFADFEKDMKKIARVSDAKTLTTSRISKGLISSAACTVISISLPSHPMPRDANPVAMASRPS